MRFNELIDGVRAKRPAVEPKAETKQLTIAQSIRRSSDPHQAAIASFSRQAAPSHYLRTYYFEDGSFLSFEVSYMAVEDGSQS